VHGDASFGLTVWAWSRTSWPSGQPNWDDATSYAYNAGASTLPLTPIHVPVTQ
jgi:hypothetical protein